MDAEQELERALADLNRQQERIADIQHELNGLELTGYADRGAVSVTLTGAGQFTDVRFDPAVLREHDADSLGQAVLAAIHDALGKLAGETRERFAEVVGDPELLDGATAGWLPPQR
jgi:hypothetical protein